MGSYAAGNEQVLAEKLKAKFASRGAAAVIGKTAPTTELIRKIENTVSPYERVADRPADTDAQTANGMRAQTSARRAPQIANAGRASAKPAAAAEVQRRTQTQAKPQAQQYVYDGSYARAYAVAASVRAKAEQIRADNAKIAGIAGTAPAARAQRTPAKKRADVGVIGTVKDKIHSLTRVKEDTEYTAGEKTKSAQFPIEIIVMIALCTLAIMLVIYTIAQIYSISSGISDLQKKQGELAKNESALQLELNERDDIRLIEQIAVEELGMVKAEAIEKNYVSILSGDKIDVIANENTENSGFFSTMLSAIGTGFTKLFEK